jgi:hypothetical protein
LFQHLITSEKTVNNKHEGVMFIFDAKAFKLFLGFFIQAIAFFV